MEVVLKKLERIEEILQQIQKKMSNETVQPHASDEDHFGLEYFLLQKPLELRNHFTIPSDTTSLSSNGRNCIVNAVVEFYVSRQKCMKEEDFQRIAQEICSTFKSEKVDTYFYKSETARSGKLYNHYRNVIAKLRKEGLFPQKRIKLDLAENDSNLIIPISISNSDKEWLRYSCEPLHEVKQHWAASYEQRNTEIEKCGGSNVSIIYSEWPAFKSNYGNVLVDFDFDRYFGCETNFNAKWNSFVDGFLRKAPLLIKDRYSLNKLQELPEITDKDLYNAAIFDLLPAIIPPTAVVTNKNTKKSGRRALPIVKVFLF